MTHFKELEARGLKPSQIMKLEREERNAKLAMAIVKEVGGTVHLFVANPIGLWLSGKLFLKGVVDPLKIGDEATRTAINQGFDALALANAAVSIAGQALPLISALGALGGAGATAIPAFAAP